MTRPQATSSLDARVETSLKHVRSRLRAHGGDASVRAIENGEVTIEWHGACKSCPVAALTFGAVVAPTVRAVEGVRSVRSSRILASQLALQRIEQRAAAARRSAETLRGE